MPSWKKVITSGSDASLNSLNVTSGVTGSLLGTASYATQALSASYALTASYAINAATASYVSSNFQYEIHVSQVDGNDTTGNGDLLKPVATIGKALLIVSASVASTDRRTVIVHPGTYIENITVNTTNTYFFSTGLLGANCLISGSVTVSAATRMSGLKMTNLIVSSSAPVYINNCAVDNQMTVSGSGYLEVQNTSLQCTSGIQVVGPASSGVIFENCSLYPLTVNNASAAVYVISCNQAITPTLTAGALTITRSTISSLTSGATSTALTTAAGSVLVLESCNVYNSLLTSHAAITANGFYSIKNIIYNRSASTLASLSGTGGPLATVTQFQYINADNINSTQGLTVTGSITVSGSVINNLTASYAISASQAVSASFSTTASYATQALSASYAPGGGAAFPYTGSAVITGSLGVTGSFGIQTYDGILANAYVPAIKISDGGRNIYDIFGTASIDAGGRILIDNIGGPSLGWLSRTMFDSTLVQSIDWANRIAYDPGGTTYAIDWGNRATYDGFGVSSISWNSRVLVDPAAADALNWDTIGNNSKIEAYTYLLKLIALATQESFSDVPATTFNYEGEVIGGQIDGTVALYDLVYLETDGKWYPVTQATADCTKLLGICAQTGVKPLIILEGSITINDGTYTTTPVVQSPDHGLPIYIRDTAGNIMSTNVPTTAGQYVRILGHAYYQNTDNTEYWIMKFRPSNEWYVI